MAFTLSLKGAPAPFNSCYAAANEITQRQFGHSILEKGKSRRAAFMSNATANEPAS